MAEEKKEQDLQLLTIDELGKLLCVGRVTIWRKIRAGQLIEPMRLYPGGPPRWRRGDIAAWLESKGQG